MAGVVGIEPTSKVLETPILPLNHTPIGKGTPPSRTEILRKWSNEKKIGRLNASCHEPPLKLKESVSLHPQRVVRQQGLEPRTDRL